MSRKGSLAGRLARLKKEGLSPPVKRDTNCSKTVKTERVSLPSGWERIYPLVWKRSVRMGKILRDEFNNSLLLPDKTRAENLIFYDTETTGLSTGAGTIPFLIGLGWINGDSFEVIQYFLEDYPGEADMLTALKDDFTENGLCVSYNGKSYDSHLINTRFLMNRIKYKRGPEIDLLYLSRRLWRSKLENCRLGTIEKHILDIERGDDIPGNEIPDVWFDFLKTGDIEKLELVFSHNLQDIYSLSLLLEKIESIVEELPDLGDYDKLNLGRILLDSQKDKGLELIDREYQSGNREAGEYLSLYHKREGDWDNAMKIWKRLNKRGGNLFATIEMAKYYEHKLKDPLKALNTLDKLLKSPLSPTGDIKEDIIYRKKRLLRKIQSSL